MASAIARDGERGRRSLIPREALATLASMPARFEELDYQQTELGELILRRRQQVSKPDTWIYEVKLGGRFLMSSLVTDSERALAELALRRVEGTGLRVLVGGLGLGHTAAQALADPRVAQVDVVERLPEVIDWHRRGLVPLAGQLTDARRCRLIAGDCFAMLREPGTAAWDTAAGDTTAGNFTPYDAILIDVDDSPIHLLHDDHESFYTVAGLTEARRSLRPGGIFALWTSLPAEREVSERLGRAFASTETEEIRFDNPLLDAPEVNAIYLARA